MVLAFHKKLVELAKLKHWDCVAGSPEDAVARMRAHGETPFHLAAGPWIEEEDVGGVQVVDLGLPTGVALLAASPAKAGLHTRIGNHVGLVAYRVDRLFMAVVSE
jgi:hypothetical protein